MEIVYFNIHEIIKKKKYDIFFFFGSADCMDLICFVVKKEGATLFIIVWETIGLSI